MLKTVEMDLQFMNYIQGPPIAKETMMAQATSNDAITIKSWKKVWIDNYTANHASHGPFTSNHVGKLYGINKNKPAIVVGSGPSLKGNIKDIATADDMMVVSCLHNFHFMIDNDVPVDYYVTLDAGEITIPEIAEGGKHDLEHYLEKTRECKLIAFVGSSPNLIKSWRGEIIWYNAPIPDMEVMEAFEKVEKFQMYMGNGGNVLGASLYAAKSIMGSNPICFAGADFSFSYTNKFHGWDSQYDSNVGNSLRAIDVFGNSVRTWQSYINFKVWFDHTCLTVPGIWLNATEGGCLGAYNEGNIQQIRQMTMLDFLAMYKLHEQMEHMCNNPGAAVDPEVGKIKLLF